MCADRAEFLIFVGRFRCGSFRPRHKWLMREKKTPALVRKSGGLMRSAITSVTEFDLPTAEELDGSAVIPNSSVDVSFDR